MERYIPSIAVLTFDPERAGRRVRTIFKDRIARTLWLGIKYKHLVNQHFDKSVLAAAEFIRGGALRNTSDLRACLNGAGLGELINSGGGQGLLDELFDLLFTETDIPYRIERKQP